ncbi:MAG TPA: hypothetical protein VNV43_12975 [Candidatus Acidoferrales bacterium]|nr:hypothetical protein [Candidatus Acidoferrales bacterium]
MKIGAFIGDFWDYWLGNEEPFDYAVKMFQGSQFNPNKILSILSELGLN